MSTPLAEEPLDTGYARTMRPPLASDAVGWQTSLGASIAGAIHEGIWNQTSDLYRLNRARHEGQHLDAEAARQRLRERSLEAHISVGDQGISDKALDILMLSKEEDNFRQEMIANGPQGIGMAGARLTMELFASLADPGNLLLGMVPIVGQARYAGHLARAKSAWGRAGVRFAAGGAQNAAFMAAVQPMAFAKHEQFQEDYRMSDALRAIAFGTVFGGGLHAVGGGGREAYLRATKQKQFFEALDGLSNDEIQTVFNFEREVKAGRMHPSDAQTALATFDPKVRAAVHERLDIEVKAAEPKQADIEDAVAPDSAAARVEALPHEAREPLLKMAVAQTLRGEEVNVEAAMRFAERQIEAEDTARAAAEHEAMPSVEAAAAAPTNPLFAAPHPDKPVFDPRLRDPRMREGIDALVHSEMTRGGGITLVGGKFDAYANEVSVDKERPVQRTPSVNPDWVQNLLAETKMSVREVQAAVAKALAGGKLGKRQKVAVKRVLDEISYRARDGRKYRHRERAAQVMERVRQMNADPERWAIQAEHRAVAKAIAEAKSRNSDVEAAASRAADESLADAPPYEPPAKSEALAHAEENLNTQMLELQETLDNIGSKASTEAMLRPYDEAITRAENEGKALQILALCDVRG